jgi:hypothetical protein
MVFAKVARDARHDADSLLSMLDKLGRPIGRSSPVTSSDRPWAEAWPRPSGREDAA